MVEFSAEELELLDKIEDMERILKRKNINKKHKYQLLTNYGKLWDKTFPVFKLIKTNFSYFTNLNEEEGIRVIAVNNLIAIGIYAFVHEESLRLNYNLQDKFKEILSHKPEEHPKLNSELMNLINIYLQGIATREADKSLNIKDLTLKITTILKETLYLPDKIKDKDFLLSYLKLHNRALNYLKSWESKFDKSAISQSELWVVVEPYILENLENNKHEIRFQCAGILQNHGRNKGEMELLEAIKSEDYSYVLINLLEAIPQVGSKDSRFALMEVLLKGDKREKETAKNSLDELAQKFGFVDGNDMNTKLKPKSEFTIRELVAMFSGVFSSIGTIITLIGILNITQNINALLISAIIFIAIALLGLVCIPIDFIYKKNRYKRKLNEWNIEEYF